VVKIRMI